ncbi:MAG: VWA domain-containing protein [Rhodobacteraceae bacterium]|nr:VWA domain-containing protein [Paracoccaceae bacterium]
MTDGWPLSELSLLRPEWLLALVGVLLFGLLARNRNAGLGGWRRAVDPHLMRALERLGHIQFGHTRRLTAPVLIGAGVAASLSGPAIEREDAAAWRNLDGVVIVLDVSRSMVEGGFFQEALITAQRLAANAAPRPTGLILFAGDAYRASAFTIDPDALASLLVAIDGDTVPDIGSRPERGLELARGMLATADIVAGEVVLISDGEGVGVDAVRQSTSLAREGRRLTIVQVPNGRDPTDGRAALAGLLRVAGSSASALGDTATPPALANDSAERLAESPYASLIWRDLGRYGLIFALAPTLFLFRRRL